MNHFKDFWPWLVVPGFVYRAKITRPPPNMLWRDYIFFCSLSHLDVPCGGCGLLGHHVPGPLEFFWVLKVTRCEYEIVRAFFGPNTYLSGSFLSPWARVYYWLGTFTKFWSTPRRFQGCFFFFGFIFSHMSSFKILGFRLAVFLASVWESIKDKWIIILRVVCCATRALLQY